MSDMGKLFRKIAVLVATYIIMDLIPYKMPKK
jgi:hypothetical protein